MAQVEGLGHGNLHGACSGGRTLLYSCTELITIGALVQDRDGAWG